MHHGGQLTRTLHFIVAPTPAFGTRLGRAAIRQIMAIAPAAILFLLLQAAAAPASAETFGLDDVADRARTIAAKPYRAPTDRLPPELRDLDYDSMRDIRFRPEQALWRAEKLPFELMFMHLGRGVREPVAINLLEGGQVRKLPFSPQLFDYGRNRFDTDKLRDIGFAGFRVHYPINSASYKDEVLVFMGASYFRALGKSQHYGLSARGLAVDTAEASGEEFPRFTEFWIEKPAANAKTLTIYALLDSRRMRRRLPLRAQARRRNASWK